MREALGMELAATRRAGHERTIATVREALGEAAFAAAWLEGRRDPSGAVAALVDQGDVVDASKRSLTTDAAASPCSPPANGTCCAWWHRANGWEIANALYVTASHRLQARLRNPRQTRRTVPRRGGRSRCPPQTRLKHFCRFSAAVRFSAPDVRCSRGKRPKPAPKNGEFSPCAGSAGALGSFVTIGGCAVRAALTMAQSGAARWRWWPGDAADQKRAMVPLAPARRPAMDGERFRSPDPAAGRVPAAAAIAASGGRCPGRGGAG